MYHSTLIVRRFHTKMRTCWILLVVFVSTSAIVHNEAKRADGYILDEDNETTSVSLNTGEFMPLKETHDDGYEENAGEVGYKFEVPEEGDKIKKSVLNVREISTEKSKSLEHEPIIKYPDPYISAQNSSTKYRPPSTSYGVPFYNTYPVPVTQNIKSYLTKFKTPQSYYITEQKLKYPKMYREDITNMKTNNFDTSENINENSDYGINDYFQGQELNQFEPYDTNIGNEFTSEKPVGNVYYTDGHEFPPEPNYYGPFFTNNHDLGQVGYDLNGFDGYRYPKLDEDETKYSMPVMKNVYMPKEHNNEAMKDFDDGPGNGYFFTKYPNYSTKKRESYVYEVPLKYKSLLFSGNGQMYGKSIQFSGKNSDVFSGLHTSSEFDSPGLQVGNYFSQNQKYLGTFWYGNTMYSFRKPEKNMSPRYKVYKIYKRKF